jgi:hypothetical protein
VAPTVRPSSSSSRRASRWCCKRGSFIPSRYHLFSLLLASVLLATACSGDDSAVDQPVYEGTNLYAGEPWDGRGRGPFSQQDAQQFGDYPLFWLDAAFEGFNLQGISANLSQHPGVDEVAFIYGTCKIPSSQRDGGCSVPLSVMVRPVCSVTPSQARMAYPDTSRTVRGEALLFSRVERNMHESAMLWTGRSLVLVQSNLPLGSLDEIVAALRGIGANGIEPGEPLPPPDFAGCSGAL